MHTSKVFLTGFVLLVQAAAHTGNEIFEHIGVQGVNRGRRGTPKLRIPRIRDIPASTLRHNMEFLDTPQAIEELRVEFPPAPESPSYHLLSMLYMIHGDPDVP
ncbi:hypothetical protein Hypma_013687 [Hypsizygus marmoreus]|uniref:Uncharacterized protein n=1 Tax=Hypsizygus marmoreus TaxID=39966 RepID=A0A369JJ77_HYPMA|nr:hypothetical protein Hypma_013687 [Hypsizygus marmoreus]